MCLDNTFSTAITVYMVGSCMQLIKQQAEKSLPSFIKNWIFLLGVRVKYWTCLLRHISLPSVGLVYLHLSCKVFLYKQCYAAVANIACLQARHDSHSSTLHQ